MTPPKPQAHGGAPLGLLESISTAPERFPPFGPSALELPVGLEWGNRRLSRPWGTLGISLDDQTLTVQLSSLWTQARSPGLPPGPLWGLWESEVLECFIVGADGRYLELEIGPYEHHLAIELEGVRRASRWCLPVSLRCERSRQGSHTLGLWRAEAKLSARLLPPVIERVNALGELEEGYLINAFACIGSSDQRRYLLSSPLEGERPDFHQPDRFPFFSRETLLAEVPLC